MLLAFFVLFLALSPGILFTIPPLGKKMGGKLMTAAMHAVLFVIVVRLLYVVREGFQKVAKVTSSSSVLTASAEVTRAANARIQILDEIKQITQDYEQTQASLNSARKTYENRKNEYEHSRNQYEEIKSEVARSEEQLKDLGVSLGTTQKRLIDMETKVKDAEMNLEKAREAEAAARAAGAAAEAAEAAPEMAGSVPITGPMPYGGPISPMPYGGPMPPMPIKGPMPPMPIKGPMPPMPIKGPVKGPVTQMGVGCGGTKPNCGPGLRCSNNKGGICLPWVHDGAIAGLPPGATGQVCGGPGMPACVSGGTCRRFREVGVCISTKPVITPSQIGLGYSYPSTTS